MTTDVAAAIIVAVMTAASTVSRETTEQATKPAAPGELDVPIVLGLPRLRHLRAVEASAPVVLSIDELSFEIEQERFQRAGGFRPTIVPGHASGRETLPFGVAIDDDPKGVEREERFSNGPIAAVFASIHTLRGEPAKAVKCL